MTATDLIQFGLIVVATVAAMPVGLYLWARPRVLIGLTLLVALFVRTLEHLTSMSWVDNLDDAFVLFCFLRALVLAFDRRRSSQGISYPGIIFFALFGIAGAVSDVILQVPFSISLSGTYLALKGILLGWSASQVTWTDSSLHRLLKASALTITFVLFAVLINAGAPDWWTRTFSVNGQPIERYGFPSMLGPFIHPFDLAFALSMASVAVLAYQQHVKRTKFTVIIGYGAAVGSVLSFRRKDLLGLLAALLRFGLRYKRWPSVIFATLLGALVLMFMWDEVLAQIDALSSSYFTVDSGEARTVLMLGAITVSTTHFPLGAGFGRYASRTAASDYSPEYLNLGFPHVYGLEPGGPFLTDTSWPAILGETGAIGTLFFVAGLISIVIAVRRWERAKACALQRWIGATGLAWAILTLFQSTGSAAFTSPPMFAFFFTLVGIGASHINESHPTFLQGARPNDHSTSVGS